MRRAAAHHRQHYRARALRAAARGALVVVLAVGSVITPAAGAPTGLSLLETCSARGDEPAVRCGQTLSQYLEFAKAAAALKLPGTAACVPARATLADLRSAFLTWAQRNPADLKRNEQDAVMAALNDAYPCR